MLLCSPTSYFALTKILKTKLHEINTQPAVPRRMECLVSCARVALLSPTRERLIELFLAPLPTRRQRSRREFFCCA